MNSKLGDASSQVKDGIATVNSGAGQISDGAKTLANGTGSLSSGVVTLFNGTKTLKDGVVKLNDEGISKITEIFGDDTKDAVNSIEDILKNTSHSQELRVICQVTLNSYLRQPKSSRISKGANKL